jgi:hypothetical protein
MVVVVKKNMAETILITQHGISPEMEDNFE